MIPKVFTRSLTSLTGRLGKCSENQFFKRLIPTSEYCDRQSRLVNLINEHLQRNQSFFASNKGSLIVVSGAKRMYTADTRIPTIHFKQNSDFLYLTGLNTKEAAHTVLVILGHPNSPSSFHTYLFAPFANKLQLIWEGDGLKGNFYRDHISSITNYMEDIANLPKFLEANSDREIFLCRAGLELTPPSISGHKESKDSTLPKNPLATSKTTDLSPFIDKLRLIKSPNEAAAMKRTCTIGAEAMKATRIWSQEQFSINQRILEITGVAESQMAAKFEYESRIRGAIKPSYPPVVAGSDRSTIIHYGANDKFVQPNEWILMDAGCEDIEGYISDITRSWPILSNQSDSRCRLIQALYEALCEVHQQIVKYLEIQSAVTSLDDLYHLMCHCLGNVLSEFGLASKGDQAALLADYFCPHHVSHYLGLDVHDTPTITRDIKLLPGMTFTIEPGLYFRPGDSKIKKEFEGIGLRIEDNYIIDENGKPVNLTADVSRIFDPKDLS